MTGQHPRKDYWRIRNLKFVTGWLHCVHPFTMSYLQYRCSCQPNQGLLFFLGFRDRACSTAASPPAEVRCRSRIKIRACWESDLAPVSASPGGDATALVLWFHRPPAIRVEYVQLRQHAPPRWRRPRRCGPRSRNTSRTIRAPAASTWRPRRRGRRQRCRRAVQSGPWGGRYFIYRPGIMGERLME
jgi:hypothetical protein